MADVVTTQVIIDGLRNAVVKLTNQSDGTGEAAVEKILAAALTAGAGGGTTTYSIERIQATCVGMSVNILWDATTDVLAFSLPQDQYVDLDFTQFAGLKNNSGAGKTGGINITTVGHTLGDSYSIVLFLRKD